MRTILFALALPTVLNAADLTPVGPLPFDDSHPKPRAGCTHRLTGQIEPDDLAKVQALPTDPQVVLCLDSPGGAFRAGVQIGAYLRDAGIGTRLEENAVCESACALIFMSGTYHAQTSRFPSGTDEEWMLGPQPWRTMHPTARLGLHAPRLNVPAGQYDEATVGRAYDIALQGISEFAALLLQPRDLDSDSLLWDPDLFARMIATPHDAMFYIDTVDKAGRYGVEIGPTIPAPTTPDDRTLARACATLWGWDDGLGAETHAEDISAATVHGTRVTLDSGLDCDFALGGKDNTWRFYTMDAPDIAFFPPEMPLSDLVP